MTKRSRAKITSKEALMADFGTLPSPPTENYRKSSSSLFSSPRLFTGFSPKAFSDSESLMSPTSILDSKSFSAFKNPFWSDSSTRKIPKLENRLHWEKLDSRNVGLGLVDVLTDEKSDSNLCKSSSRVVLFGVQLKVQIPPLPPPVNSPVDSPISPVDFGIKTKNSVVGPSSPVSSPSSLKKSPFGSANSGIGSSNSPRDFSSLSRSEMELSEEYTRVISHGPNPKTTHIFDDCVVESCYGNKLIGDSSPTKETVFPIPIISRSMSSPSENFLSFCHHCKKNLSQGNDIYMYRGDQPFCSVECRFKEMMLDKGMEIPEESTDF